MNLIRFKPVYKQRPWGGRQLAEKFGRNLPDDPTIGESWEIVDRPKAQSIDENTGLTLRELIQRTPESIMGPGYDPSLPFPVLVKWLDCSQRLSLQVHPPSDIARTLHGEPKTECWYIADASDDAALIVGLKNGIDRAQFEDAIIEETLESMLHRFAVKPGQAMLLEAGRLHAIDAGNLILEIQQNSDTTYRVYDWGRKGLDGKPRQLHVEQSLKSIDFDDIEPEPLPVFIEPGERVIADCPEFRIRQFNLGPEETLELPARDQPRILSLVCGGLLETHSGQKIRASENILAPFANGANLKAQTASTLLITDGFI